MGCEWFAAAVATGCVAYVVWTQWRDEQTLRKLMQDAPSESGGWKVTRVVNGSSHDTGYRFDTEAAAVAKVFELELEYGSAGWSYFAEEVSGADR